jgi:hypothetical protein
MMKITGSGSISQRHESADLDPDPHKIVMDPQHWFSLICNFRFCLGQFICAAGLLHLRIIQHKLEYLIQRGLRLRATSFRIVSCTQSIIRGILSNAHSLARVGKLGQNSFCKPRLKLDPFLILHGSMRNGSLLPYDQQTIDDTFKGKAFIKKLLARSARKHFSLKKLAGS